MVKRTAARAHKTCFVVAPSGDADTETRERTDTLVRKVIEPGCKRLGLTVEIAHASARPGPITMEILQNLVQADLVVVDLTELRPNVLYELGIRHSANKPVVIMAHMGVDLPFDLGQDRTLFYDLSLRHHDRLNADFRKFAREAMLTTGSVSSVGPLIEAAVLAKTRTEAADLAKTGSEEDVILHILRIVAWTAASVGRIAPGIPEERATDANAPFGYRMTLQADKASIDRFREAVRNLSEQSRLNSETDPSLGIPRSVRVRLGREVNTRTLDSLATNAGCSVLAGAVAI